MKKQRILMIIFISVILCFLLYKITYRENFNVLYIGENSFINKELNTFNNDIKAFTYDRISLKELNNNIIKNDYYIIKNKKIFIDQLINQSKLIIIYTTDLEECKKNKNIMLNNINNLYSNIKRMSNSKIVLLNSCYFFKKENIINYNGSIAEVVKKYKYDV